MKKRIKVCLGVLIILLMSFNFSTTVYAKANLSVLKNGTGWHDLSYQDQCDTVDAMIQVIAKELGLPPIEVSFFEWPGSSAAAWNNAPYINSICVNMSTFKDDTDAEYAGETVEYHVVKIVAHEVRHSYQCAHKDDNTEFGRAVSANLNHYVDYDESVTAYYEQFMEVDANAYGDAYASRYVKNGKLNTQFTAKNGKLFDAKFYADTYSDVRNALGTDPKVLLNHYNTFGIKENRMANKNDKP